MSAANRPTNPPAPSMMKKDGLAKRCRRIALYYMAQNPRSCHQVPPAGFNPRGLCSRRALRLQRRHTALSELYRSPPGRPPVRAVPTCAEHVRQLGGESPLANLMEVKV